MAACERESVWESMGEIRNSLEGGRQRQNSECAAGSYIPIDTDVTLLRQDKGLVNVFVLDMLTPDAEIMFVSQGLLVTLTFSSIPRSFFAGCPNAWLFG